MSAAVSILQEQDPRPIVDLIYFDAGGGHRTAAYALAAMIERRRRPWRIRMVNLRDVLDPADPIRRLTGVRVENFYNELLRRGLTIGTGPMLRITQFLIRMTHRRQTELVRRHWVFPRPDLVVSLIPNFNRALLEGLRGADKLAARPPTPMVTIMTDLADCPPHFWIEPQEQYLVCGTAAAARQAQAAGYSGDKIIRVAGMIVRAEFHDARPFDRGYARRRLGLREDMPVGLVMFGGYGSRRMLSIARRIAASEIATQIIFICGHNGTLAERIRAVRFRHPVRIEGFTQDVAELMHVSDYFIGKPGPASISEAIVAGLPVIVERNFFTMVQERYNTDWIAENGVGMVVRSTDGIVPAISSMLRPGRLQELGERVRAMEIRAVFQIPDVLDRLLASCRFGGAALAGGPTGVTANF